MARKTSDAKSASGRDANPASRRDPKAPTRRDTNSAMDRVARPAAKKGGAEGPSQRQLRVAEEVRHALSAVFLREDFRDPDLHDLKVTVTEVRASPDLKHMTAFVSGLGKDLPAPTFAALKRVQPFLRTQVSKAVRLRVAPELHFQPDTALDYAMHISKVMQNPVVQQDLSKPAEPTQDPEEP